MGPIYYIGILCYGLLIRVASLFNVKAKDWVLGRENWRQALKDLNLQEGPRIWIHAASLGEMEQGLPILMALKNQSPNHRFVLSFFSPSGYQNFKERELADAIVYLPLDSPRNARDFIELLSPDLAIFIKYEIWPNLLQELKSQGVKTLLAPAVFRSNQIYFKVYGGFFRKALKNFDTILVQDQQSLNLIQEIGHNANVCGDSRFDRAMEIKNSPYQVEGLKDWISEDLCLVVGSSWTKEENLINEILAFQKNLKVILAPHQIEKSNIQRIVDLLNSHGVSIFSDKSWQSNNKVLIIDNIGQLKKLYRFADLAFIGGGFGAGVHSTVEAAVYEIPLSFGPNHLKFVETKEMIAEGLAYEIRESQDLSQFIQRFQNDSDRKAFSESMAEYLSMKTGATKKIAEAALKLLDND